MFFHDGICHIFSAILPDCGDIRKCLIPELGTDIPAFFVCLEMEGVVWSDNMFTLLPGRPVAIHAVRGEIKGMPAIRQLSKVDEL